MNQTAGMRENIPLMTSHQQKSTSAIHPAHANSIDRRLGQPNHVDNMEHSINTAAIRVNEDFDRLPIFRDDALILFIPLLDV